MSIAVTGATGHLGRLVIDKLKGKVRADEIIALARSTSKAAGLGVSVREADYGKPHTFRTALAGVDVLLLISSSEVGQRPVQHRNVIEAAKVSGVKRIVYTSLLHADTSPLSLAVEHVATETDLKASGLDYAILRNGWYLENHTASIGSVLAGGTVIGRAGAGEFSAAARVDYAEAAAVVLTDKSQKEKIYELAGDVAYTLTDYAAELSRQTQKAIPYVDLPEAEYAAKIIETGLPEWLANAIASWDTGAKRGALYDGSRTLSKLIGRPTTLLGVAVADALKASKK